MGVFELPENYIEIKRVNLQKDMKLAILVNAAALVIAAMMVLLGLVIKPISFEIQVESIHALLVGSFTWLIAVFALLLAMIAYLFAHEITHGIFIKRYSGQKAKYGFTGLYAYAGSDAYFNRQQYLIIALAPVVIFGVIFLALCFLLPDQWFWFAYIMQIINLSGAAGDLYLTYTMCKMPSDVLTCDKGTEMLFYSRLKSPSD